MYSDLKFEDQIAAGRHPKAKDEPDGYVHVIAVSDGNERAGRFLQGLGQFRLGCGERDWAEAYYCNIERLPPLQDVLVFLRFTCDAVRGWRQVERRTGTILPNGDIALDGRVTMIRPLVGEIHVTVEVNEVVLIHNQPLKRCIERGFQEREGATVLDRICRA